MKLHRATAHADWDSIAANERNVWQHVAARTNGIVTPGNAISILGIILVCIGVAALLAGRFWPGLGMIAAGRAADIFDGTAANYTGTKSRLGEAVDATLDKLAAIVVFIPLLTHHWIPVLPLVVIGLHVSAQSAVGILAYRRGIVLHPSADGKLSTVAIWAALLSFILAIALRQAGQQAAHNISIAFAYALTVIAAYLSIRATAGYYREVKHS